MILSEKLLTLRTRAGLSQEELAEKLNVSRQSVSKWESGASIPGIDKILEISRIYGISTDYLLKDEMEDLPGEVIADVYHPEDVREISVETATEYLSVIREAGKRIALGVGLCILCPFPMMSFIGMSECGLLFPTEDIAAGVGVGVLLAIVAVAVILFVLNGLRLEEYEYLEKEEFRLSYGVAGIIEKEEKEYLNRFYQTVDILGGEVLPDAPESHKVELHENPEQDAVTMRRYLGIAEFGPVGNLVELLKQPYTFVADQCFAAEG